MISYDFEMLDETPPLPLWLFETFVGYIYTFGL